MLRSTTPWKKLVRQGGLIVLVAVAIGLAANQVRPDGLAMIADWSAEARATSESGDNLIIPLEEALEMHASGAALFLDARPDVWYEMGHIQGARNLPPERIDELKDAVLKGIPSDRLIVTYCDGENCELSHNLALALLESGFTNVRVLVNGWTLWSDSGLPVEEGRS